MKIRRDTEIIETVFDLAVARVIIFVDELKRRGGAAMR